MLIYSLYPVVITSNLPHDTTTIDQLRDANLTSCVQMTPAALVHWKLTLDLDQIFISNAAVLEVNVHGSASLCRADRLAVLVMMHRSDDLEPSNQCQGHLHRLCPFQSYANEICSYNCQCDGNCDSLSIVLVPKLSETVNYDLCEITLGREW